MQEKEYTWRFACGKDNPIGLKMEFTMDADDCVEQRKQGKKIEFSYDKNA